MNMSAVRDFLEEKALFYNRPEFIETDPVLIPRLFDSKENMEISGFLVSTIAWGNRISILKNGQRLMRLMENDPYRFILQASSDDLNAVSGFVHRTFNGKDTLFFLKSLKNIYMRYGGLDEVFSEGYRQGGDVRSALIRFHDLFFDMPYLQRTYRHVADAGAGSAAKRLNLFLRWMVRKDDRGVDLGIWNGIPPSALMLPLDVHSGRVARELGLLHRRQNDWKAVEEVTCRLRSFDPVDPVKYDFALFGLGIFEKF